jgi:hypothetical protein
VDVGGRPVGSVPQRFPVHPRQVDGVHHRDIPLSIFPRPGATHLDDIPQDARGRLPPRQRPQLPAVGLVDGVVGIHPEDPPAARVPERFVAGGREVVALGEMEHVGAQPYGDRGRLVRGAHINHHHEGRIGKLCCQLPRQTAPAPTGRWGRPPERAACQVSPREQPWRLSNPFQRKLRCT